MWFGYYPEIIFCHFFCNLNLVIFKCTIMAGDINSLNLLVHILIIAARAKYGLKGTYILTVCWFLPAGTADTGSIASLVRI